MSTFQWTEDLRVGDAGVDRDHQGLFALVRELEDSDRGARFMAGIIGRLEDYAAGHFAREEELMRRLEYPEIKAHMAQHRSFVEWVDTVKATYQRSAESPFYLADQVNEFLEKWLVNHIRKSDMDYKKFMDGDAQVPN
ncbi:MAG: hemerythrin family protein [Hyphomicrobiales bacterium]|nr:hemerythrin family protein [Hyphomicrobiales bacterium]MCP5371322.1 hemerythrin family protein [Hyphomicrobiales bacterium]